MIVMSTDLVTVKEAVIGVGVKSLEPGVVIAAVLVVVDVFGTVVVSS